MQKFCFYTRPIKLRPALFEDTLRCLKEENGGGGQVMKSQSKSRSVELFAGFSPVFFIFANRENRVAKEVRDQRPDQEKIYGDCKKQ